MSLELVCFPSGYLAIEGEGETLAVRRWAVDVAGLEAGALLVALATRGLDLDFPPEMVWAREWGRMFLARLCQTRDPLTVDTPDAVVCAAHAAAAPPFSGAEYVTETLLVDWWQAMKQAVAKAVSEHSGGIDGWLRESNSAWHLVGRVTFHLAENKTNNQKPFAFLATYTEKLSESGQPRHLPLARALQQFSGAKDTLALDKLLGPVRIGAEKSSWLRVHLADKRLFQPLAMGADEAYAFLRESAVFQAAGIVVKLPDWWHGGSPPRPKVAVQINAPTGAGINLRSLLSFSIQASLDGENLTAAEMDALLKVESGLVSLRGRWIEVNGEQLRQALAHWRRMEQTHAVNGLNFHDAMRLLAGYPLHGRASGEGSATADTVPAWTEVVAGKNLELLLENMHSAPKVTPPLGLQATLRPYQLVGLGWLEFLTNMGFGACLADDMGLGKTLQILGLLVRRAEASDKPKQPALLVVPASLVGNWRAECARFAPKLRVFFAHPSVTERDVLQSFLAEPAHYLGQRFDAVLTTYQVLQRSDTLRQVPWSLAILDEAQAIKNPGTATTKAVKELHADARITLTGTPVENRPSDLWSLFDFLNPGLLGTSSAFAQTIQTMANRPSGFAPLRRLVQPYILRRLKTDRKVISDLPEKTEVKAWCGLTKRQAKIYARLVEELSRLLDDDQLEDMKRRGLVLSFLMKFKQVCNHPSQWNGDAVWGAEDSGKFLRLSEICGELAGRRDRVLVFTQFQEMCEPLSRHLKGIFGRTGLVLHGGTPVKKRAGLVEEFQKPDGPPYFVISVKAGGTGLNLTAASHVIHFDRWWNPAVENQATDRAFRIGQKKNVFVHKFVCQGTVEERIDQMIEEKNALAADLVGSSSTGETLLSEMSREELLHFVALDMESALI